MPPQPVVFLDEYGQPLHARLQEALAPLVSRLRHHFSALTDDCTVTEILEEAGRRIAARETRKGPLDNLPGYAWVVARRMAALRLRHDTWPVAGATGSATTLAGVPSDCETAAHIEARILLNQLYSGLTSPERALALARQRGLSVDEVARLSGTSPLSVFNAWRRLKRKISRASTAITADPARRGRLGWKKKSSPV